MLGWTKSRIRACLRTAGYDIRRRGSPGRTMRDALEHLRQLGWAPASVIDVGVALGTPDLYRVFPKARYLLIEPLMEYEPALRRICNELDARYVLSAACAEAGESTLYLSGPGTSPFPEIGRRRPTRIVPATTVDIAVREHGLVGPFLIKADVQGGELDVLRGASQTLAETDAVVVEVALFSGSGPALAEVAAWMKDAGFSPFDICGGNFRPYDGTLAQVDMLFVKSAGRFLQYRGYFNPQ